MYVCGGVSTSVFGSLSLPTRAHTHTHIHSHTSSDTRMNSHENIYSKMNNFLFGDEKYFVYNYAPYFSADKWLFKS